ncbi:MAG: hypothetical protein H0T76_27720 [Nannocystis sp.]|nr:hypothetical protein [Nannocystis sp.]MBA3550282.1 hypothetical protein [Nannocystis sp.]
MKLPPTTTWPSVGLLCLCSCTSPVFVGTDDEDTSTGTHVASETSDAQVTTSASMDAASSVGAITEDTSAESTDGLRFDLPSVEVNSACLMPALDCDAYINDDDQDLGLSLDLEHALGLNCEGGGVKSSGSLELAGAPGSWQVVGELGDDGSFAPRHGTRAVLLSTGVAAHILLAPQEVVAKTECSQIGLPCPSTDFPEAYDLDELPPPLEAQALDCPPGQPLPGPGDCSQTIDSQWGGEPRLAHDYTELRFVAEVPADAAGITLHAAFFTAEYPPRFPTGYNDLGLLWLESEQWTGNFAVHPTLQLPLAAEVLKDGFDHTGVDPALASFAFAEHAATDWMQLRAPVLPGETITLVAAVFDVGDGQGDSALLLDDLRWDCIAPTLGHR